MNELEAIDLGDDASIGAEAGDSVGFEDVARDYATGTLVGETSVVTPAGEQITTVQDEKRQEARRAKLKEAFRDQEREKQLNPPGSLYKKIRAQTDLGLAPPPEVPEIA